MQAYAEGFSILKAKKSSIWTWRRLARSGA